MHDLAEGDAPASNDLPRYMAAPAVARAMQKAATCGRWLHERLFDQDIDADARGHLTVDALSIALEHHAGMLNLLCDGKVASAFSLMRPCFEALTRGIWLARGATDVQFQLFLDGKDSLNVERMLRNVRKRTKSKDDDFLFDTWAAAEKSLHQYTHVSAQLIYRRQNDGFMESEEGAAELANAIRFVTTTAMLAAAEIANVGMNEELKMQALKLVSYMEDHP